ncbi:MAG: dTDP-4-dehydrorhamnose reductase [Chitinivibrionales bacterium]|nr:dTDP-4-dehydrorhamnose reductase [Chitinivibrionales bacterium]
MKLLVLGCNGQLGRAMCRRAAATGYEVTGVDIPQIDLRDIDSIVSAARACSPEVIINCSAYTAVDRCESEPEPAYAINRDGAANAAHAARDAGALLVHFSTDYVFDGTAGRPYTETDEPSPASVYGKSKLAGEQSVADICERHQILRLAWLYGADGQNFVKSIVRAALAAREDGRALRIVHDQHGTPTCADDVCDQTYASIATGETGIFHCTAEGACTWFDFGRRIVERAGIDVTVEPCTTDEYPRPAPRPAYSVLENARYKQLGCNVMPQWDEGFDRFVAGNPALLHAPKENR